MGCVASSAVDPNPRIIVGSTTISSKGDMVIIGSDLLIPLEDKEKHDSSVIKIDLKSRKYEVIRGFHGKMYQSMMSKSNNSITEEKIDL